MIKAQPLKGFRDFLPDRLIKDKNIAVFIDAANIVYSQQTMGWQLDYKKLAKVLHNEFTIVFLGFYYGEIQENKGQERFFQMLRDRGYTVRTKPVKYIKTSKGMILKGNLDIELAYDVFQLQEKFDTCILFSGDSDFEVVLRYLKILKKHVIVISSKGHVSIELIKNSDKYLDLKKLRPVLERT